MENKEMDTCKLLYNTERVKLYIPEYGRNVQKMVDYIKTIEDRQKRNEQARAVIKVMEILNPAVHLQDDYEHKLWDHLFIISGFDLDVDAPYPMPAPESMKEKPLPVEIQKKPVKATHYGRNIENMLEHIALQEDGPMKDAMIKTLATYTKQQYLIWNKDSVSEETIFNDIHKLSNGRITVPDSVHIGMGMTPMKHRPQNSNKGKQNGSNNGKRWKNNK